MSARPRHRNGFALVEVLVATLIAAGVVVAASAAIGGAVALQRRADGENADFAAAETMIVRLRAGMGDADVLRGFPEWTIAHAPFADEEEVAISKRPYFDITRLQKRGDQRSAIDVLTVARRP